MRRAITATEERLREELVRARARLKEARELVRKYRDTAGHHSQCKFDDPNSDPCECSCGLQKTDRRADALLAEDAG